MDHSELQAFISVAEAGSFSQAAEQLFITQPAVSKRISALETELDTRLFDRIGRTIRLTEAGAALLPRARHIVAELEDSKRLISKLSGRVSGTLRVGTSHHIGLHRLPPVLRSYIKKFPEVNLDLRFMDSEQACRGVLHGDLELGIVTLPLEPEGQLLMKRVWDDPLSIVVSKQHELARRKHISIEMLSDYPAILPARGTFTRELLERRLQPLGRKLQVSFSTNYLETIKMMVNVGLAWSVLPDSMVSRGGFRRITLKQLNLIRYLGFVHHASRTLSNAGQEMINLLNDSTRCPP